MDCSTFEEELEDSAREPTDALLEHAEACESCADLAAADPTLGPAMDALDGGMADVVPAELLAQMETGLGARLEAERGPAAWLRAQPSAVRTLIAIGFVVLVGVPSVLAGGIPEGSPYSPMHMGLAAAALCSAAFTAIWAALRPLHRPPLDRRLEKLLIGLGVLVPLALAFFGPGNHTHEASASGLGAAFACLGTGLLVGVPLVFLAFLLDRRAHAGLATSLLAASSGALAGNLLLQLKCPMADPGHLLAGHFGMAAVLVVGYALVWPLTLARRS